MKSSLSMYLSRNKEATEEIASKQNLDRYKINKMPYYFKDMGLCNYEKTSNQRDKILTMMGKSALLKSSSYKPANRKLNKKLDLAEDHVVHDKPVFVFFIFECFAL